VSANDTTTPSLSTLRPPAGSRHRKVRVGRGMGSKLGKTAGKGNKGGKSRSGYRLRRGFEGGQMPLHRRLPKRGFNNIFGKDFAAVNLSQLGRFTAGETVTPERLRELGMVRDRSLPVKILGDGDLGAALTVRAHAFSRSAKEKISAAGGTAELVGRRTCATACCSRWRCWRCTALAPSSIRPASTPTCCSSSSSRAAVRCSA
jgi:large subunit ribosomal protein L15